MKVDLGFMKIPLEGTFDHRKLALGIGWACFWNATIFAWSSPAEPALNLTGPPLVEACRKSLVVTALWWIMYYNYIGVQVLTVFIKAAYEMISDDDVTTKFAPNAARFAGNMFEQSPVFLWGLWMYTLFVDYESAWCLGVLYMVVRSLYPFYYIVFHQFDFWFESCTQVGYGVNGIFTLGCLVNGLGGDWVAYATRNPVGAPVLGYFVGNAISFGIPYGWFLTWLHYKVDHEWAQAELLRTQRQQESL